MGHVTNLKKKLKARIEAGPVTYEDVARELGVVKSTVHNWANEAKTPTPGIEHLLALARMLGVTVDYLLDDAQEGPPRAPSEEERLALAMFWRLVGRFGPGEAIDRLMDEPKGEREQAGSARRKATPAAPTHLGHSIIPTVIHTVGRGTEADAARARAQERAQAQAREAKGSAERKNGGRQPG